jgi:hypothetical protein
MKKVMLALVALVVVGMFAVPAEAGRWRWRRAYAPPVVVRPYVAPVYVARPTYVVPPVVVARPVFTAPAYRYYGPSSVYVGRSYYGGGVQVRTPGFGLRISY